MSNRQAIFLKICNWLEIIMAVGLILIIVVLGIRLIFGDFVLFHGEPLETLDLYIGNIMILAVGIELVKMLSQHSPSTIIEVLMFAIAREVVMEHGKPIDTLLGVAAIAILFATRKFLFLKKDYVIYKVLF